MTKAPEEEESDTRMLMAMTARILVILPISFWSGLGSTLTSWVKPAILPISVSMPVA